MTPDQFMSRWLRRMTTGLDLIPLSELASHENKVESSVSVDTRGAVGQEAPTSKSYVEMTLGEQVKDAYAYVGNATLVDRLRGMATGDYGYSDEDVVAAANEIERLKTELDYWKTDGEVKAHRDGVAYVGVVGDAYRARDEAQATIAHQQAMLVALVECKDALLAELYDARMFNRAILFIEKAQRTSYPAKATPEMVTAMCDALERGLNDLDIIQCILAAAPPDDRDARIAELEAEVSRWTADYFEAHKACKRLSAAAEDRNEVDALRDKAHREDIAKFEEERDELKRQLDKYRGLTPYANGYADALEHGAQMPFTQEMIDAGLGLARAEIERLRAKCPPDDVLEALIWLATVDNDGALSHEREAAIDALIAKTGAWQASKAAPDGLTQFKALLRDVAENPEPLGWDVPAVVSGGGRNDQV